MKREREKLKQKMFHEENQHSTWLIEKIQNLKQAQLKLNMWHGEKKKKLVHEDEKNLLSVSSS